MPEVEDVTLAAPGDVRRQWCRIVVEDVSDLGNAARLLLEAPEPRCLWVSAAGIEKVITSGRYSPAEEFAYSIVGVIIPVSCDRCSDCEKLMSRKIGGCFNELGDDDCDGRREERAKIDWLHVYADGEALLSLLPGLAESWWYLREQAFLAGIAFSHDLGPEAGADIAQWKGEEL